jgi:hypothetical protein
MPIVWACVDAGEGVATAEAYFVLGTRSQTAPSFKIAVQLLPWVYSLVARGST